MNRIEKGINVQSRRKITRDKKEKNNKETENLLQKKNLSSVCRKMKETDFFCLLFQYLNRKTKEKYHQKYLTLINRIKNDFIGKNAVSFLKHFLYKHTYIYIYIELWWWRTSQTDYSYDFNSRYFLFEKCSSTRSSSSYYFFSKAARLARQSIEAPDNDSSINVRPNELICFWHVSLDSYANIWVKVSIGNDGANLKRKKQFNYWRMFRMMTIYPQTKALRTCFR